MDAVPRQNGDMVEQSAAASHALANGGVELARLMGPFPIGGAAHAGAAGRPIPRPSAESLYSKAFRFGGAVAAKPAALAETDTWEEF